jgi:2-polyprenyl-3-methyl-5-hydroxy-6-metoxy-1,4-benzoquinol methylase
MATHNQEEFPHLERFSNEIGVAPERLVEAFRIEKEFHEQALRETDPARLSDLYRRVYEEVHALYGSEVSETDDRQNAALVRLLRRELEGRSILDLGCGQGTFLRKVAALLPHKDLVGIDTSRTHLSESGDEIEFVLGDVVDFDLGRKFDVVFSDQVVEHIAPQQFDAHLRCVRRHLRDDGVFVVLTPNRLFGPSDVTRIVDCSRTNRVPAAGTHLNEMTHAEMVPILRRNGFRRCKTVLPKGWTRFPNLRISPMVPILIERVPPLVGIIHWMQRRTGRWLGFGVTLLCRP